MRAHTRTHDFLSISIFVTPISFLLWLGDTGEQKESYLGEDHEGAGAMETTWKAPRAAASRRGCSPPLVGHLDLLPTAMCDFYLFPPLPVSPPLLHSLPAHALADSAQGPQDKGANDFLKLYDAFGLISWCSLLCPGRQR